MKTLLLAASIFIGPGDTVSLNQTGEYNISIAENTNLLFFASVTQSERRWAVSGVGTRTEVLGSLEGSTMLNLGNSVYNHGTSDVFAPEPRIFHIPEFRGTRYIGVLANNGEFGGDFEEIGTGWVELYSNGFNISITGAHYRPDLSIRVGEVPEPEFLPLLGLFLFFRRKIVDK